MSNWFTDEQIDSVRHIRTGNNDEGCLAATSIMCSYKGIDASQYCTQDKLPIPGIGDARSQKIVELGCQCPDPPPPGTGIRFFVIDGFIMPMINENESMQCQPNGTQKINNQYAIKNNRHRTPMFFHLHPDE